jgi:cellulose synthase/poly-beta-1,6-N-acetylglucosamine synthase-like glycosyltransferase
VVDRSERRRSQKEARNVIMERASSDLLVHVDADVIVPPTSLFHLLRCLTEPPLPAVAVGVAAPDPHYRSVRHRAAAWQMNATRRYASWLPVDAVRAEGACWAAWSSFYREYRFPLGAVSLHDDISLALHLRERALSVRNCWKAVVYKVPAGTLRDFMLQTLRFYAAGGASTPRLRQLAAGAVEAAKDPLGAGLYVHARIWAVREQRRRPTTWGETWEVTSSTKRS